VERLSGMGERVFLKKSHPGSPLGFRTRTPYARDPSRPRVLFLGDSYTEGSGRSVECNYPTVAEATLVRKLGMEVEVMNAGVGGYGPADALDLLRFLVDEGYRFDAVAFHLFLENDFTDNLPGTERRVLAGVNFRVPQSRFLRWFHPLNWRTFRFGLFVVRAGSLAGGDTRVLYRDLGDCKPEGERLEAVSPVLRTTVMRRLEGSARAAEVPAAQERVGGAIEAMQQETQRLGIPFALVLFPDRALVDPELKSLLALDSEHLEAPRNLRDYLRERFAGLPVIDLTPVLEGEVGLYRARDTHLSDRGNDRVGRFVGERLAEQLAGAGLRGAGTEVRD
jgi:hypothetical protein